MSTSGEPVGHPAPGRVRLDRPVLVGNLVSGALLLSPLVFLSPPLLLIGAIYVVVGSVFLAAAYARPPLTRRQELLTWIAPWLTAAVLWASLLLSVSSDSSGPNHALSLVFGLLIATPCYLIWQLVALMARLLITRPARRSLPS